jgi:hypothetical protein
MVSRIYCDRCNKEIPPADNIFYGTDDDSWYQGHDICQSCSVDIELLKSAAQSAAIKNISIGEALQRWLGVYKKDE